LLFSFPRTILSRLFALFLLLAAVIVPVWAQSQDAQGDKQKPQKTQKERAEEQLKEEEHQRVLGIVPQFNTFNGTNAAPLTARQKSQLAFKSVIDPGTIGVAALDAGYGQLTNSYPEYRQGVEGYAKYLGASYADSFDGTILGNALFPSLFHEDPRYFRKGTGTFGHRLLYAVGSTVRARSDSGKWVPNYGNLLGNLAAGGIANLYYPEEDRGAELTFERALTVSAEGAFGGIFYEFWPDVSRKLFHRKH
jgi:hypothetical protein